MRFWKYRIGFRFVLFYLLALFLSQFIADIVLDLDRSLQVDEKRIENFMRDAIKQAEQKDKDHSGVQYGLGFGGSFEAHHNGGSDIKIRIGQTDENRQQLLGEYKPGMSRRDWLQVNHVWTSWLAQPLAGLLLLWFWFRVRPASTYYYRKKKGVLTDGEERARARRCLLSSSRIAILDGLFLSIVAFAVQAAGEFAYIGFHWERLLLITLSSVAFVITFTALVLGLFDPLILRLVPDFCEDDEIYAARSEARFFGIAFRVRTMVLASVVLPLSVLFLTQVVYSPLLRSLWLWLISVDHDPAVFAKMLPDLMNAFYGMTLIVVSLIIGLMITRGVLRSLVEPLQSLALRMEKVGAGDFAQRTSVLANDEIGRAKAQFNRMLDGLRQREAIKDTFGKFMGSEVSEQILNSEIELGGTETEAAILFSDIRGFTSISEAMSPKDLVSFLNQYLSVIVPCIHTHHGVVNKYIGDAVLAMFGVPVAQKNSCENALQAALTMQMELQKWNMIRVKSGLPAIGAGIGIHAGPVIAGNIGSSQRMEYTVIGDTVNIASRIESETKNHDAQILVSQQVLERLAPDFRQTLELRPCGQVLLKGKSVSLPLWEVLPSPYK